jgi:DNA polymerase-1
MYELVTDSECARRVVAAISGASCIGLDLETTGFSPLTCKTRLLSLRAGEKTYVVDLFSDARNVDWSILSGDHETIGQNLKFDAKFLAYEFGVELRHPWDTFRASYMRHNGNFDLKHDLYAIRERELGVPPGPELGGSDWSGALTKEQLDYAGDDVEYLIPLRDRLRSHLQSAGLLRAFAIEMGAIAAEVQIELNGFRLDAERWRTLAARNKKEMEELGAALLKELPRPDGQFDLFAADPTGFNLDSSVQVMQSLARIGIRLPDTQHTTLCMAATKYPVLDRFMRYRELSKHLSSFGPAYLKNISAVTGRIHPDYWPLTAAGRYSCRNPNLQQIPRNKAFRDCFRPPPGRKLVLADYSAVEARVVAEISQDRLLLEIFRLGQDVHKRTASELMGIPLDEVTPKQRQSAKPLVYGLSFGLGPKKLVLYAQSEYNVTLTEPEAAELYAKYFRAYSGIKRWHNDVHAKVEAGNTVTKTLSGRLRYLSPDDYNAYKNTPIQGTAADGLKSALAILHKRLKTFGKAAIPVHMSHDEVLLECDEEVSKEAKLVLESSMVDGLQPLLPSVPVVAEGSICDSWAEK